METRPWMANAKHWTTRLPRRAIPCCSSIAKAIGLAVILTGAAWAATAIAFRYFDRYVRHRTDPLQPTAFHFGMAPIAQKMVESMLPMMLGCTAAGFLFVAAVWLALQAIM